MSADLMEMLLSQLGGNNLSALSNHVGANEQQTTSALSGLIPVIMGALAKNASTQEGASSLFNALQKDHDGSVLENLMDGFTKGSTVENTGRATDGLGILGHLFGDKMGNIAQMIGQMSGMNNQSATSLMQGLAPLIMGMLGKTQRQQNLDSGGLMSLLTNQTQQHTSNQGQNQLSLVGKLLDSDGDGSIMDDLASIGMRFLSK